MAIRFGVYSGDSLAVERILSRRLAELGEVERVTLFGDQVELGELLSQLSAMGLFGGERALIVRRADSLVSSERLTQVLRDGPPPGTALFFLGEKLVGPLARLAEEALHFPAPTGRELRALAGELLTEAGLPVHPFLVELLAEACGGDTLRLAREVEKLSLWRGEKLSRSTIPQLLFFAEPTPYAFLDAVGERRLSAALAELKKLLVSGWDPFRLFFVLLAHVRALLAARAAWEGNRRPAGPDWLVRRRLAQARRFSLKELVELLARLQELDVRIKTGRVTPEGALYLFTLSLVP